MGDTEYKNNTEFYGLGDIGLFTLKSEKYKPSEEAGCIRDPRTFLRARDVGELSISNFEKERSEVIKPFVEQFLPSGKRVIILDVGGYIGTFCIPIA